MSRSLFLLAFVYFGVTGIVWAQNCNLYPNRQTILAEYGVKSIRVYIEDYGSTEKTTAAIYFLDNTGCAWRWVTRRLNNGTYSYYVNQESGSWQTGKKESYSAYLDKDSNEVLIEKCIDHISPSGKRLREERWNIQNGKLLKTVTSFGSHEPDILDRDVNVINETGDTLTRLITRSDSTGSLSVQLIKENNKWIEKNKSITKKDTAGMLIESVRWESGKIVEGRKYEAIRVSDEITDVIESDLNGNPKRKTRYSGKKGDHWIYEFRNGKWVFIDEVLMPEDDPIEENAIRKSEQDIVNEIEESGNKQPDKTTENKVKASPKTYKRISSAPPVERITYSDPASRTGIIMKEKFTAEGLILESDIVRDRKKMIYNYEFFE